MQFTQSNPRYLGRFDVVVLGLRDQAGSHIGNERCRRTSGKSRYLVIGRGNGHPIGEFKPE